MTIAPGIDLRETAIADICRLHEVKELSLFSSAGEGVSRIGVRLGNWLTADQGKDFSPSVDRESLHGVRNYPMLALLIG